MSSFAVKGAFLVNAGAASPDLLKRAGITHVAHQLSVHGQDNGGTAANFLGFPGNRAQMPFATHGGWGVTGPDVDADVALTVARIQALDLKFWIFDTELYWLAGWDVAAMTDKLITGVRAKVGAGFLLAVVSFGYSTSGHQGASLNSGLATCRRLGVDFIPETYDYHGISYGLDLAVPYLRKDGITAPSVLAIGDKTIQQDVGWLAANPGNASGVWVWAAEQAATDIVAVNSVVLGPTAPLPTPIPQPSGRTAATTRAAMRKFIDLAGAEADAFVAQRKAMGQTQAQIEATEIWKAQQEIAAARRRIAN